MASTNTVGIKVVTDSSGAVKGIEMVGDSLKKLGGQSDVGKNLDDIASASRIEKFKNLGGMIKEVASKVIEFGSGAIEASAKWVALDSQWTQIWGGIEGEATKAMNKIGKETSILPERLQPAMTSIAAFAKTAGFDQKGALDLASRATIAAADSAAFYDRSLEDTTESLKSYLKGNYENDAALGISSTETTRNAAANKLYGKSFKDLAEDQKQLTLLQMVEDGNKLSGALGQAAREGDGLENVMGNLKQVQENFMRAIGDIALPTFIKSVQALTGFMQEMIDKFKAAQPQFQNFGKVLTGVFDNIMKSPAIYWLQMGLTSIGNIVIGLAKNIGSGMQKVGKVLDDFLGDVTPTFTALSAMFGGWAYTLEQVFNVAIPAAFEILTPILSGFLDFFVTIMNGLSGSAWKNSSIITEAILTDVVPAIQKLSDWAKDNKPKLEEIGKAIAGVATAFLAFKLLSGIAGIISGIGTAFTALKVALSGISTMFGLLTPVIAAVGLPITALIGVVALLTGAFVYLWQTNEQFRTKIVEIWNSILEFLQPIIQAISDFVMQIWGDLKAWWDKNGQEFLDTAKRIWGSISSTVGAVMSGIWEVITIILGKIQAFWDKWGGAITTTVKVMWTVTYGLFKTHLANIWAVVQTVFNQIASTIEVVGNTIKGIVKVVTSAMKGDWKGAMDGIKSIVSGWGKYIGDTFDNVMNGAKKIVSNTIDGVKKIFDQLWDIDLWGAGQAIIDGFIDGLTSTWEKGKEWVSGIGDWIAKHKGPISYDRKLLIDNGQAIMFGLNKGLAEGFKEVQSTVGGMAEEIQGKMSNVFDNELAVQGNASFSAAIGSEAVANKLNNTSYNPQPVSITIGSVDSDERVNQLSREVSRAMEIQYRAQNQFE